MTRTYSNHRPLIWLYSRYQNQATQLAIELKLDSFIPHLYWLEAGPVMRERLAGSEHMLVMHWHCEPIKREELEFLETRRAVVVPVHCTRPYCFSCEGQ